MGIGIWGDVQGVQPIVGKTKVNNAYKSQEGSNTQPKKDDVEISNISKDYNVVSAEIKDLPDIREEKVNELLKSFDNGQYNVTDEELAEKFVDYMKNNEV